MFGGRYFFNSTVVSIMYSVFIPVIVGILASSYKIQLYSVKSKEYVLNSFSIYRFLRCFMPTFSMIVHGLDSTGAALELGLVFSCIYF